MKKYVILCVGLTLIFQSCAKIFYSPDARSLANSHKIIAIAPPKVSIAPRKNIDASSLIEQQNAESVNFQKEMYSWMLQRKMQGSINVEIQEIETTNARLSNAAIINEGLILTPNEMCRILAVDGIMTSNYALSKPMSEGAAIALGVLIGFWGATNETTASLSIHDHKMNKLIWNYSHKLSSSLGTPESLVDALMRQASRKMPYFTSPR